MTFRHVTEWDLNWMYEHRSDASTRRYLGHSRLGSFDEHRRAVLSNIACYRVIYLGDEIIGVARVGRCVGFDLVEKWRGKGLGLSVFKAILEKFPEAVELYVFMENVPAVKIYERCRFRFDPDTPVQLFFRDGKTLHYARMTR